MIFRYDASQEMCPLPLLNLRLILKKMTTEDMCVFQICDIGSKENIPKLLTKLGYCFNQRIMENKNVEITLFKAKVMR